MQRDEGRWELSVFIGYSDKTGDPRWREPFAECTNPVIGVFGSPQYWVGRDGCSVEQVADLLDSLLSRMAEIDDPLPSGRQSPRTARMLASTPYVAASVRSASFSSYSDSSAVGGRGGAESCTIATEYAHSDLSSRQTEGRWFLFLLSNA